MARKKYKKRSDGRFETTIKIGVDPDTGRPIRKHIYARTQKELDLKMAEYKKRIDMGLTSDKPVTFAEYAAKWFELTKSGKSDNTKVSYQNILKNHMKCLNNKRIDKITKSDVQLQIKHSEGHRSTQQLILLMVRQILDNAVDDGLVFRNVSQNIKLDPERKEEKRRQLTQFELDCIAAADLDPEERCFVSLLLYTGMRKGEVLALNMDSIDLKAGVIHVTRTCVFADWKETDINHPKTNAGFRDIPIFSPLMPVLRDYLKSIDHNYLFMRKDPETGKYRLLKKTEVSTMWNRIYKKLNDAAGSVLARGKYTIIPPMSDPMRGITPHYFRHNFATLLYYANVDIKEAARIMGHSDINVTLKVYAHLNESKSGSLDKIESYLKEA